MATRPFAGLGAEQSALWGSSTVRAHNSLLNSLRSHWHLHWLFGSHFRRLQPPGNWHGGSRCLHSCLASAVDRIQLLIQPTTDRSAPPPPPPPRLLRAVFFTAFHVDTNARPATWNTGYTLAKADCSCFCICILCTAHRHLFLLAVRALLICHYDCCCYYYGHDADDCHFVFCILWGS